ncbi:hypothetical protein [Thiohalomonas denitrificans]|uniref:hypothetical protein n=1 Tax=Thiohalomonas denitrificans TaxID=415747 RepID=UPI0026ED6360|nr:hypothetical protein [Thiohalomonas denitrificans]
MNRVSTVLFFGLLISIVGVLYTGQIYFFAKWERDIFENLSPERDPTLDKIPILLGDVEQRDVISDIISGFYERESITHDILTEQNENVKMDALFLMAFWVLNFGLYASLLLKLRHGWRLNK